jgi:hypothetical protein
MYHFFGSNNVTEMSNCVVGETFLKLILMSEIAAHLFHDIKSMNAKFVAFGLVQVKHTFSVGQNTFIPE